MLDVGAIPDAPPRELRFKRSSSISASFRELYRRRELIRVLATRDFIARYKQTFLGVGWSVLQPLAVVLALSLFLRRLTHSHTGGVPYVLWSFVGLIPWSFFSGALSAGVGSLLGNQPLLNKVRCPREAFPIAAMVLTGVDTLISVGTLSVLFIATGTVPEATCYWIPVLMLVQLPMAAGGAVLGSIVVVYLRDLRNILPLVLQLGLFVTPIAFNMSQVPSRFRLAYSFLNPVAPVIDGYRRAVLYGLAPDWSELGAAAISSAVLFLISFKVFKRLELGIADLI
ncbi:ABC transporter permease [uncultured Jatrophihabitans sp.]|uniref:ABC transporter permease n=1 Tax=uncultured Jatrophihabitans sp. TaxID=1610747 RepID=UPI0035CC40C8